VALQPPKPTATERLKESEAWLHRSADRVLVIRDPDALPSLLERELLH
jgi:hypothetical protein